MKQIVGSFANVTAIIYEKPTKIKDNESQTTIFEFLCLLNFLYGRKKQIKWYNKPNELKILNDKILVIYQKISKNCSKLQSGMCFFLL